MNVEHCISKIGCWFQGVAFYQNISETCCSNFLGWQTSWGQLWVWQAHPREEVVKKAACWISPNPIPPSPPQAFLLQSAKWEYMSSVSVVSGPPAIILLSTQQVLLQESLKKASLFLSGIHLLFCGKWHQSPAPAAFDDSPPELNNRDVRVAGNHLCAQV